MKKERIHYSWFILIACCMLQFGSTGAIGYTFGIFFKPVTSELNVGIGSIALYITIQNITAAFAMPIVSKILPRKEINYIVATAMAIISLIYIIMSKFTALWQWYIAGIIVGAASSFVFFVPMPILITNWFEKKTGFAMGIGAMFSGLGGAVVTPLAMKFMTKYGWRSTYIFIGILSALVVIPVVLLVIRFRPSDLGLKPYGASEKVESNNGNMVIGGVSKEIALKSKTFKILFVTCGMISINATFIQHFPTFFISIGITPTIAASFSSVIMISTIFIKIFYGWLNDRVGVRNATTISIGFLILSFLAFIFSKNLIIYYIAAVLFAFSPTMMALTPSLLTRNVFGIKDYSSIFAFTTMGTSLISAFGSSFYGFIYDTFGSYTPAFIIAIFFFIIAWYLMNATLKESKNLSLEELKET